MKFLILLMFSLSLLNGARGKTKLPNLTLNQSIDINKCMFKSSDLRLKTYKYGEVYLEDLRLIDLLKPDFRVAFFKYLKHRDNDEDFKTTLFTQLLMTMIQQTKDSNAFFLLSEEAKDDGLSVDGVELLSDDMVELFLQDPYLFIHEGIRCNNLELVNYIMRLMNDFIVEKTFFKDNIGEVYMGSNCMLLNPDMEHAFSNQELINKLKNMPKVEGSFSPSYFTAWENKAIMFTDIKSLFGRNLVEKLNIAELNFYKIKMLPVLNKYIMTTHVIQDPDGYTNLRKEKNATSEILQQIKSGMSIDVLDDTGDWYLVETIEGNKGYVHKSRIKFE